MSGAAEAAPSALLQAIMSAPDEASCRQAADQLADLVQNNFSSLAEHGILEDLIRACGSKSGFEREGGVVALGTLFDRVGSKGGADAAFLPLFGVVFDRLAETAKGAEVVREAAERAYRSLVRLPPPELVPSALTIIFDYLEESSTKWKSKLGALDAVSLLVARAQEQVADRLGEIIPRVQKQMQDSKRDVAEAAMKTAKQICGVLSNPDLLPFTDDIVKCMAAPNTVPEVVKLREVDGPTLAVVVPLLIRAFSDRSTTTQRQVCLLASNLFKMVRTPDLAAKHTPLLIPGVERIAEGAAFPEIREHANEANRVLKESSEGGDPNGTQAEQRVAADQTLARTMLVDLIAKETGVQPASIESDKLFSATLSYVAEGVAQLVCKRDFEAPSWDDIYVRPYLARFIPAAQAAGVSAEVQKRWLKLDEERNRPPQTEDDGEDSGELIVDLPFSLAYGGLLLLNHTTLRLRRGHCYGVCGANGAGKSTLLKAIRDKKIDQFPEALSAFYVEHSLDGEDSGADIVEFLVNDPVVKGVGATRERILKLLEETGFDEHRRGQSVGALSGGWKMRLAIARAMIANADLLLLDEPTNHLDVQSIAWLQDYLKAQKDVTIMTVSHDSGFLDAVCTDIIHYEKKRLVYYRGNLERFVAQHPAAKSYYTLSASQLSFSFPPPGSLMGVRSNTRAILKASHVTYTYPGAKKPSLLDASCAVSLSSRVGVVGPNGAGKSTLIKLLTGETIPDSGQITKHPNLRVAYIAQHAFHHIEQHLDKTATQYIKWRYANGMDRELAEKQSRKLTDEERKVLETPITSQSGEKRYVEMIIGRQKLKKSFQYEIKFKGLDHRHNAWIPRERLIELGFSKIVAQFDDFEASREGSGSRELSGTEVLKTLTDLGLDPQIAEHNEMSGLSGGQKVKVVIAAAMWSKPQVLILDEPTNFLDRDALGGLATAIRDWAGAFLCISHNQEFVGALCPEIWEVDAGILALKGKVAIIEDAFEDTPKSSKANSRIASRVQSPAISAANSANNSSNESPQPGAAEGLPMPVVKKKRKTRAQLKAQEERRRARTLAFLTSSIPGTTREPDTRVIDVKTD